jgi:hypothetical protein
MRADFDDFHILIFKGLIEFARGKNPVSVHFFRRIK